MSVLDWLVLIVTLTGVIGYGLYKRAREQNLNEYFLSGRSMPWYLVLLGIVGTQASAITFLSAPGQAFTDGMRFVQYYFGLPLAMVVICIGFIPIFSRLNVYTAYAFLEERFGLPTRLLTSGLFLISRGLSTGISICAPAIILSSLLGWNLYLTSVLMGGLLIIYTVSGGARAVAYTQQIQLIIIFAGMGYAGWYMVHHLPPGMGFTESLHIAGAAGKMNIISTGIDEKGRFDFKDKYNLLSGLIGGFFLALSYFGTDQSQVGRYITARNLRQGRLGLLLNGLVKVPMQFCILGIGILLFSFYHFTPQPIFFNQAAVTSVRNSSEQAQLTKLESLFRKVESQRAVAARHYALPGNNRDTVLKAQYQRLNQETDALRLQYRQVLERFGADANDTNYIFLRFVYDYFPAGLIGLLISIIFLAAWGSIAAALNALASASMVDFYCRLRQESIAEKEDDPEIQKKQFRISKWFTLGWGLFSIGVAMISNSLGSLIEAVNILGSLFYGVMLGIFLVAFYLKRVGGQAVFVAAVISELLVILLFWLNETGKIGLSFLWLNAAGALLVLLFSLFLQALLPHSKPEKIAEV